MTLHEQSTGRGYLLSVALAFVASGVINFVISLIARALGADASTVVGLNPAAFLLFALVGLLIAAGVWVLVRSRSQRPTGVMRVLVPVVVLISLVPDVLVGLAGFGWVGAVALMLMHLSVAACGVAALRRFLHLPDAARAAVA